MANEILVNTINDALNNLNNLTESNWIKLKCGNMEGFIVITLTSINFIGNSKMILNDCYTIYFENHNLLMGDVVTVPSNLLEYYLDLYTRIKTNFELIHLTILMKRQIKVNDKIIFENNKRGIIVPFKKEDNDGQVRFSYFNKDGTISKRRCLLYGNISFQVVDREFIDYKNL